MRVAKNRFRVFSILTRSVSFMHTRSGLGLSPLRPIKNKLKPVALDIFYVYPTEWFV